ncbi:MAG: isopeptide-forming domain-containing fimbrial protein [Lachnospiraceae bacterium]|nr:isopeptide-forming domain-containing fimbrial protein [Lachnospiraceae bacterium]
MSKMKKLIGMMLALAMVLAMSVMVFADNDDGSITITNATAGETYSVYKMLDLTYDANQTSYAYTIDSSSEWYAFFTTGAGADYVSVDITTGKVTWTAGGTGTGTLAATLAKAAMAYAEENGISPTATDTATGTTLTFSGLEYGYYLVDSSLGSLCSLDSTTPSVEVTDKNPTPTVDKTVQEDTTETYGDSNTADVGETVNFRVEITNAYSSSNLVLHDTMSEGLTLNEGSFTIKVGSSLASADSTVDSQYYTITTSGLSDGCTFEIAFEDEFLTDVLTSSQVIVVTYTATVNADAVIGSTGNSNETYVSYGNEAESTKDETITYVYELYVYKYTNSFETLDGNETALSGAKFVLYKEVSGVKYYAVLDSDGIVSGWTQTKADATELETDSTGLVYFGGLDAGSYYLEETEAPDGYNILAAAVDIEIASDGTISGTQTVTVGTDTYTAIAIYNGSSDEMPSTGGIGTTIFYIVGGVLVVGAAILLITRRRMNKA